MWLVQKVINVMGAQIVSLPMNECIIRTISSRVEDCDQKIILAYDLPRKILDFPEYDSWESCTGLR
jgi:hypothetical protein